MLCYDLRQKFVGEITDEIRNDGTEMASIWKYMFENSVSQFGEFNIL